MTSVDEGAKHHSLCPGHDKIELAKPSQAPYYMVQNVDKDRWR